MTRGIRAVEDAARQFTPDPSERAQARRTVDLERLKELRERLELAPEVDAALTRDTLRTQRRARRLALHTLRRLKRAARTPRTITLQRIGWLSAMFVVGATIAFIAQLRDRFDVTASSRYAYDFRARNVIDGDEATEWLAPDKVEAWLDFKFRQPIDVSALRIVNGRNASYKDRATKDLEITLFAGDARVGHKQVTLPDIAEKTRAITVPIRATGVTRIRFLARTHYGKGVSLAEIEVIERK